MKMLREVGLVLLILPIVTAGLLCYQCKNFQLESGSSKIFKYLEFDTDPSCYDHSGSKVIQCPDDDEYSCELTRAHVNVDSKIGDFKIGVVERDCIKTAPPGELSPDGCLSDSKAESWTKEIIGISLSLLLRVPIFRPRFEIKATTCLCSQPLCSPDDPASQVWKIVLLTIGLVLLLVLGIALGCCCRKHGPHSWYRFRQWGNCTLKRLRQPRIEQRIKQRRVWTTKMDRFESLPPHNQIKRNRNEFCF